MDQNAKLSNEKLVLVWSKIIWKAQKLFGPKEWQGIGSKSSSKWSKRFLSIVFYFQYNWNNFLTVFTSSWYAHGLHCKNLQWGSTQLLCPIFWPRCIPTYLYRKYLHDQHGSESTQIFRRERNQKDFQQPRYLLFLGCDVHIRKLFWICWNLSFLVFERWNGGSYETFGFDNNCWCIGFYSIFVRWRLDCWKNGKWKCIHNCIYGIRN